MGLLRDKRGLEIVIMIFTVGVLLVFFSALFIFITQGSKLEDRTFNYGVLTSVFAQEQNFALSLDFLSEQAVIDAYKSMVGDNFYAQGNAQDIGYIIFENLNSNINEEFRARIESSLNKPDAVLYGLDSYNLEYTVDGNSIIVRADGGKFEGYISDSQGVKIDWSNYPLNVRVGISLSEMGLASFQDIYYACKGCISESDRGGCISSKLDNFNVKVKPVSAGRNLVELTSKKKFIINGKYESVKLSFVM
ncbi:MAG: hypothetical protein ABIH72_01205 [archaeon]